MAVAQLVTLFETLNGEASVKSMPRSFRKQTSSSSRVRLHLQTIFFSHNPLHRSAKSSSNMSSTSSSSVRSSPGSSYSSFGRTIRLPTNDLNSALSPTLTTSSVSSPTSSHIRRQPSAIDLALEAEKYADQAEIIGLGLLEPRPRANTASTITSSSTQCSMMEFMTETMQTPVVLDGIFEVMERA